MNHEMTPRGLVGFVGDRVGHDPDDCIPPLDQIHDSSWLYTISSAALAGQPVAFAIASAYIRTCIS